MAHGIPAPLRTRTLDAAALADALRAADFTVDAVADRLGSQALAGLGRNSTLAAQQVLADQDDAQATLVRAMVLQQDVDAAALDRALPGWRARLEAAGLLECDGDRVRATIDIRPYGADAASGAPVDAWVVSDHVPGLDGAIAPTRPDFVLGASPASATLTRMTMRRPVGRALDLGTGCGVQSLHLAGHADSVVATDLNPRALELADLTLRLAGVADRVELCEGSLWEPVAGERFDLVVTNPPYVMAPPRADGARLTYREGTLGADRLVEQVVRGAADHLSEDGVLQVLGNWAHVRGQDWHERVAEWIAPTGADALVMEREVLDPYEYVEIWLADAGLVGHPAYVARAHAWLDYLDGLGIAAIGMGWITLHRPGRAGWQGHGAASAASSAPLPQVRIESWPHTVVQPVAVGFADWRDGKEAATWGDERILATSWRLADTVQETYGEPGEADPEHIVVRQRTGFARAIGVDTALAGVLGACDGELPLGVICDAVADLLETDPVRLRGEMVARFRELCVEGFLRPGYGGQ